MTSETDQTADIRGGAEQSAPPRRYWLVNLWVMVLVAYAALTVLKAVVDPLPLWVMSLMWLDAGINFATSFGFGLAMLTVALAHESLFASRLMRWLGAAQLGFLVLGLGGPFISQLASALSTPEPAFTSMTNGGVSIGSTITVYGPNPLTLLGLLIFIGVCAHTAYKLWKMRPDAGSQGLDG